MIVKRSISIRGHPTSISIEDEFWSELRAAAARRGLPVAALIASIDADRGPGRNLSSAIRIFVLAEALRRLPRDPRDQRGGTGGGGSGGTTPGSPS